MGKAVEKVFVTNVTAANTGTNLSTIINGDVLVFNRTWGTALTGSPTVTSAEGNDTIYICLGQFEGNVKTSISDPIVVKNVISAKLSTYTAPAELVQTISFGTLTISDNTEYDFNIQYINVNARVLQQKPMAERYSYVTSSNTSQEELAFAMAVRAGNDSNANIYRKVEVLSDGTFTASSGGATTVTQYSNVIYIAESAGAANDAGKYNADASSMTVGDILRIGGTSSTTPLYKITAVSGVGTALATITLSEVYQGSSGSVSAANLLVETTPASTYSLRTTGIAIPPVPSTSPIDLYTKVNFTTSLYETNGPVIPEFTVTTSTDLQYGTGYWEQIRDKEFLAAGYRGTQNRTMFPGNFLNPPTHAVSGYQYDVLSIYHYEKVNDGINGTYNNDKITTIAFKSDVTTKRAEVVDILESLFESVGVFVE
jgi:hypothetical protein